MKVVASLFVCFLLLFFAAAPTHAAKFRVRKSTGGGSTFTYSTAKLSRATNSVIVTFQNLGAVKRVAYELSYRANGTTQGAMGTVQTTGLVSDSRDLYFGTCSHGVCTPHYNITGAALTITTTLSTGGTNIKRYRIKL